MKTRVMAFVFALGLALFLALSAAPVCADDPSQAALDAGKQAEQGGDRNTAFADYNQAIQINPKNAAAFERRAYIKWGNRDIKGALADYSQAISLDPTLDEAFTKRGEIKFHVNFDTDGAIADFDQAIALNHWHAQPYCDRGDAKLFKKDVDGAIADYTEAIRHDYRMAEAYQSRGYAEYEKTFLPGSDPYLAKQAVADLQKSIDLNPNDADYPHFFIWLIQTTNPDQADEAMRDLTDYLNIRPGKQSDWEQEIGNFLTGNSSEDDLLKAANVGDKGTLQVQHSEAFFYLGMKHLYNGDKAGAATFFKKSVDAGSRHGIEEEVSQLWLDQAQVPNQSGT